MKAARIVTFGVTVCGLAMAAQSPKALKVKIMSGEGKNVGTATFKPAKGGVKLKIELHNLPLGEHGVHIHQNAVCEGPDFKTAGAHLNPDGKKHGFMNPDGHHNGDLPENVKIVEGNAGEATFMLTTISMDPAAANSIFSNGGTSLVVHEKADDMKTDPSGSSGNRIACAVIKR